MRNGRRAVSQKRERAWRRHQLRAERLREALEWTGNFLDLGLLRIRGYYPAHPTLFSVLEVGDAIGASQKVIRAVEGRGMIKSERLPGKKARKLFFKLAAIRQFLNGHYLYRVPGRPALQSLRELFPDEWCSALRSVNIALNPDFVRGNAVTIEMAAGRLGIKNRTVRWYLETGELKKVPCGHRTVLVTRGSLEKKLKKLLAGHFAVIGHKMPGIPN